MNKLTFALLGLAFVTVIGISVSIFLYSELSTTKSTLADIESRLADTESRLADTELQLENSKSSLADVEVQFENTKSSLVDAEVQLKSAKILLEQVQQKLDTAESDLEIALDEVDWWYVKWDSLANPACTPGGIWTRLYATNTKSIYFSLTDNTAVWYLTGETSYTDDRERSFNWSQSGNSITAASAPGALKDPSIWTLEFSSDCNTLSGTWSQTDGGSGAMKLTKN